MKRIVMMLGLLAVLGSTGAARGDLRAQWDAFWTRFEKDYHRNNCWPTPFVEPDRAAARAPWAIMEHNGWRTYNTLAQQSFNEQNQLTSAGKMKVRWIVTQAPAERRSIYVLRGETPDATRDRLESVRETISEATGAQLPEAMVVVTDREPRYGTGEYMDMVDRKARGAIPVPVLPAREQMNR